MTLITNLALFIILTLNSTDHRSLIMYRLFCHLLSDRGENRHTGVFKDTHHEYGESFCRTCRSVDRYRLIDSRFCCYCHFAVAIFIRSWWKFAYGLQFLLDIVLYWLNWTELENFIGLGPKGETRKPAGRELITCHLKKTTGNQISITITYLGKHYKCTYYDTE